MLSSNNDKRLQTFDGIETYPYGTNAFKLCKSETMTVKGLFVENYTDFRLYDKTILQWQDKRLCKIQMINFDNYVNENKTEHNKNWSYIPDHPYRVLIIGCSGSGITNVLLNLIENQPGIYKIYLYAKDPYEAKYQYLINIREKKA